MLENQREADTELGATDSSGGHLAKAPASRKAAMFETRPPGAADCGGLDGHAERAPSPKNRRH